MSTLYVDNLQPNLGSRVMAAGHVVQVVPMTSSSVAYSGSEGVYSTGVTGSITPTSTTSKILIAGSIGNEIQGGNYPCVNNRILRNSTVIRTWILRSYLGNAGHHGIDESPIFYLDSPNSTSSVTYEIQGANASGSTYTGTYLGRMNYYNSADMYLMEIAQ
jgi:hypothetical protein